MYAVGYPKAKALAQFVNSKAFFLSPGKKARVVKKSIDFLTTLLYFIVKFRYKTLVGGFFILNIRIFYADIDGIIQKAVVILP